MYHKNKTLGSRNRALMKMEGRKRGKRKRGRERERSI